MNIKQPLRSGTLHSVQAFNALASNLLVLLSAILVSLLTLSYSELRRLLQGANEDGPSMCNSTSVHVIQSTER